MGKKRYPNLEAYPGTGPLPTSLIIAFFDTATDRLYRAPISQLPGGGGSSAPVAITPTELRALAAANKLGAGLLYLVTPRSLGQPSLVIQAISTYQLTPYALLLNADGTVSEVNYQLSDDTTTPRNFGTVASGNSLVSFGPFSYSAALPVIPLRSSAQSVAAVYFGFGLSLEPSEWTFNRAAHTLTIHANAGVEEGDRIWGEIEIGPLEPAEVAPTDYAFTNQTVVTITHNLGRRVLAQVFDTTDALIEGQVKQLGLNSLEIQFSQPLTGRVLVF